MSKFSFQLFILISISMFTCSVTAADDATSGLAGTYGFSGIELFKLDRRAFNLVAADFDSDGTTDIIAVDNQSSCLRLFHRPADGIKPKISQEALANDLNSDERFETRQIPVDKRIAGIVAADFNGDGKVDLAYTGDPDRLVVRFQPESGQEWSKRWSVRLPELLPVQWTIATGDLDSDGRSDIAVLGKQFTYVIYQKADGMQTPQQLINTSSQLSLLSIADMNGDGKADLVYQSNQGSTRSVCVRLQLGDQRIGPEHTFDSGQPRSLSIGDVDGKKGDEVLTIDSRTGRLQIYKVTGEDENQNSLRPLVRYGIGNAAGGAGRKISLADIDGDGRTDAVVTDPENAQLLLYRQKTDLGLGTSEAFPGLLDASALVAIELDQKLGAELIQASNKEGVIAVSGYAEGRITFPRPVINLEKDHSVIGLTVRQSANGPRLAVLSRAGRSAKADLVLTQYVPTRKGQWKAEGEETNLPASRIGSRGAKLQAIDVNDDNVDEILIAPEGNNSDGLTVVTFSKGEAHVHDPLNVGVSSSRSVSLAGGDLLVARDAFARRMQFQDERWTVADQFNAGESRARIVGAVSLDLDQDAVDEIALIDTGVRRLRLLKKTDGLYRPWQELELGTFDFQLSAVSDLNGDGQPDLLLFGKEQFAVLYSGPGRMSLTEISSWEPDRDDAYAVDVAIGDVNDDSVKDLIIVDTGIDGLALVNVDSDLQLQSATHFRIFEEKRLVSSATSRGKEPREVLVADVTGDDLKDVILLCHDRLLVFPQEISQSDQASKKD